MLNLYITDKAFQEAREDVIRVKSRGEHTMILDADEARELEPATGGRVVGGGIHRHAGALLEPQSILKETQTALTPASFLFVKKCDRHIEYL